MPLTPIWSIFYRNTSTPAALETESALQATSIENALTAVATTAVSAGALTSIIPTSVVGTGVSLGVGGKVSIASASSASINGCFTSTFDNYLIYCSIPAVTGGSTQLQALLRIGGTDATSANYDYEFLYGSVSTAAAVGASAQASWQLNVGTGLHQTQLDLMGPALNAATFGTGRSTDVASVGGAIVITNTGLVHRLTTAYDGITIKPTAGTFTGSVRIYGYNNN